MGKVSRFRNNTRAITMRIKEIIELVTHRIAFTLITKDKSKNFPSIIVFDKGR